MKRSRVSDVHQQSIFDTTGLLPTRSWKVAVLHGVLLLVVVFITEISDARAHSAMDIQMERLQIDHIEPRINVAGTCRVAENFGLK